jgi:hypothetical protein
MHNFEHFVVVAICVGPDAVIGQGLGRTATALVQGGDEAWFIPNLFELLVIIAHGFE